MLDRCDDVSVAVVYTRIDRLRLCLVRRVRNQDPAFWTAHRDGNQETLSDLDEASRSGGSPRRGTPGRNALRAPDHQDAISLRRSLPSRFVPFEHAPTSRQCLQRAEAFAHGLKILLDRLPRWLFAFLRDIDGLSVDKFIGHSPCWNWITLRTVGVDSFLIRFLFWIFFHRCKQQLFFPPQFQNFSG
jgi:hypothetical protein